MTLGLAPRQADLFRSAVAFCEGRVAPGSMYGILHRECFRLFPDEMFADLFEDVGRWSMPPMIVAAVMVLQRIEGCSDPEAADRFAFDAWWKYAAGGLDFDYPGVRAHGAGRHAGPAGPLGAAGPDLRGDPGRGPGRGAGGPADRPRSRSRGRGETGGASSAHRPGRAQTRRTTAGTPRRYSSSSAAPATADRATTPRTRSRSAVG